MTLILTCVYIYIIFSSTRLVINTIYLTGLLRILSIVKIIILAVCLMLTQTLHHNLLSQGTPLTAVKTGAAATATAASYFCKLRKIRVRNNIPRNFDVVDCSLVIIIT